jgi:NNP family nitrate/nitrite transporter-like MFS transporter
MLIGRSWLEPLFGGWRGATLFAAAAMAVSGFIWIGAGSDRAVKTGAHKPVLGLLKTPAMLQIGGMQFLLFGGYLTLLGLLPRALTESGVEPARVGVVVASWLLAAAVANFAGPVISDRIGRRKPLLIGGAIVAGLGLLAFAALSDAHLGGIGTLVIAALGGGSFAPLLLTLPFEIEEIGIQRAGAAIGLLLLLGQVGGFLLPIATGAVADAHGLRGAIGLLALLHLAITLFAFRLRETGRAAKDAELTSLAKLARS